MNEAGFWFTSDGARRIVHTKCALCPAEFDGLVQSPHTHDGVTAWQPSIDFVLRNVGWLCRDGRWFCGRFCADKHSYASKRGFINPAPVTKLADASYQAKRVATK